MDKKPLPPGFQSRKIQPVDLPDPSSFRQLRPSVLGSPPSFINTRGVERKRLIIGFGIAAAFHLCLAIGWWLMPPLRLKVGIDPRRWVQVVSVPPSEVPTPVPIHAVPTVMPHPAQTPSGVLPKNAQAPAIPLHHELTAPAASPPAAAEPPPTDHPP